MLKLLLTAGLLGCVCIQAQQPPAPALPPPAVVAVCIPDLSALQPLGRFDVGTPMGWKGGRAVVEATISFDGNAKLALISSTDRRVAAAAVEILDSWKFAKYQPGKVDVTLLVKVSGPASHGVGKAKVEMDLPNRVVITVPPYIPEVFRTPPAPRPKSLVPAPQK